MRRPAGPSILAAFATALILGGAAPGATGPEVCNPSGRQVCVTIADTDGVSRSSASGARFMTYAVTVRNRGNSTLTNGVILLDLRDVVGGQPQASTASWVRTKLTDGCSSTAPGQITCLVHQLKRGESTTFGPMPVTTSQTANASATRLVVTAGFKEKGNDSHDPPGPDPQSDTFTASEDTGYENNPERSATIVFSGVDIALDTATNDEQSSVFPLPVPQSFAGFGDASLEEFDKGQSGYFCPASVSCFGQSVTTVGRGIFSPGNPAELLATVKLSSLPYGVNEWNLRVHHRYDKGTVVSFKTKCSGGIGTAPPASELPCRRVSIDSWKKRVVIDAWDVDQGNWGFS